MNRKVGKFKLWQLLAIGGGLGLALYLYEKGKTPKEEQVGLAAATRPEGFPGTTGGGEGVSGGVSAPIPGPPGEPGIAGAPGAPAVAEVTPAQIAGLEAQINALNQPLQSATRSPAAPPTKFPQVNSRTGEHYRTEKSHGKTVHVYHSGKRVVVGSAKPHRKTANAKHQANKTGRTHAHPANPNHQASHAAPVAVKQHTRAKPLKKRVRHR